MVLGRQRFTGTIWRAAALLVVLLSASACVNTSGNTLTLAFLGDVMIGRDVYARHQDGDWDTTLAAITPTLQSADLVLANLESPVCLADTCASALEGATIAVDVPAGMNLCALPGGVSMLSMAGIDMLSVENNHSTDCDEFDSASREEYKGFWEKNNIELIQAENQPVVKEINGITVAILAFDDITAELDIAAAQDAVAAAGAAGNFTIVSIHWGAEYQASPTPRQHMIAAALSEAGADIIWGHHPHVLQAVDWINREDGRQTLVMYSLGNALFDQFVLDDTRQSAALTVTLGWEGIQGLDAQAFLIDPFKGMVHIADPKEAVKILQQLHLSEP